MQAKTIKGKSPEEIQSALQQSLGEGYKPTLAILFLSVKQDREAVCKLLHKEQIEIFGTTTSGEFISSEISEGGIVIMLLDINPAYSKFAITEKTNKGGIPNVFYLVNFFAGHDAKRQVPADAGEHDDCIGIIIFRCFQLRTFINHRIYCIKIRGK